MATEKKGYPRKEKYKKVSKIRTCKICKQSYEHTSLEYTFNPDRLPEDEEEPVCYDCSGSYSVEGKKA